MSKKALILLLAGLMTFSLAFAGCAPEAPEPEVDPEEIEEELEQVDPDDFIGPDFGLDDIPEVENKEPIHVALEAGAAADLIIPYLERFADHTGVEVTHESMVFADLYSSVIIELMAGTGAYDLVVTETSWTNEWKDFLYPMHELADMYDPEGAVGFELYLEGHDESILRMASTRDGVLLGVPYYTYTMMQYYRADVYEHPEEQEAFKEQYGYELAPATNYEELNDHGEFFTRQAGDTLKGEVLEDDIYAFGMQAGRFPHVQDEISTYLWGHDGRWARLVEEDGEPVGFKITQEDMEILEAAFEEYANRVDQFAPPGSDAAFWDMAAAHFVEGNVMNLPHMYGGQWDWCTTVEEEIEGAVAGAAQVPEERGYTGAFHFSPSLDSDNPEAAYWLLKYIGSESTQDEMMREGWSGVHRNVYEQHAQEEDMYYVGVNNQVIMDQWDAQADDVGTYLHFNSAAMGTIYDEMTIVCHEAAVGDMTPQEAVNAWIDRFTDIQSRYGELPVLEESIDSY